jgi:hypothetical protein
VDADGVPDASDVCPLVPDAAQADADGDRIGDACNDALDPDGDELVGPRDVCTQVADPAQVDGDGDGVGDACDPYPALALHVRPVAADFAWIGQPTEIGYRLEDPSGALVDLPIRMTLTTSGSARFDSTILQGTLLEGGGTGRVRVEFEEDGCACA